MVKVESEMPGGLRLLACRRWEGFCVRRNFHLPGRPLVYGVNGAAATSHPLASQAAIGILRAGGNAVDAAIGACAVQCVVEPAMTGVGGDCFALIQIGGGDIIGINGSGHAPAGLSLEFLEDRNISAIEVSSPHGVTIPGAVDTRSEEHTSELQSLMRLSYAVFGLKK